MKIVRTAMFILICIFGSFFIKTEAFATNDVIYLTGQYNQTEARSVLQIVNDSRALKNVPKLTWDYQLESLAMQRAAESVLTCGNYRPDGTTWDSIYSSYEFDDLAEALPAGLLSEGYYSANAMFADYYYNSNEYANNKHKYFVAAKFTYNGYVYWAFVYSSDAFANSVYSTVACDSEKSVEIILNENIILDAQFTALTNSLSIDEGSFISTPAYSMKIKCTDMWPENYYVPIDFDNTMRIADTSISSFLGQTLKGNKAGTTYLTSTKYNKTVNIPITVNHVPVIDEAVNATESSFGLTQGSHCQKCGAILIMQNRLPKLQKIVIPKRMKKLLSVSRKSIKNNSKKITLSVKAKGKVTYKIYRVPNKAKKYITLKKNGTVILKEGAPKGKYIISASAAATADFSANITKVVIKVK